jgi:hypothetical protein
MFPLPEVGASQNCPEGCKFTKTQVRGLYDDLSADRVVGITYYSVAQNESKEGF